MWRALLYTVLFKPLAVLWFGLSVHGGRHLPRRGPALVVANHNSHLDVVMLLSAFRFRTRRRVFAAAAADTFFRRPLVGAVTRAMFGALPVERDAGATLAERLGPVVRALERGRIVIVFPEGTRGEPDQPQRFRRGGLQYLCERFEGLPIVPAHIEGAARAMPKGTFVPMPFSIDVEIGPALDPCAPADAWREAQHAVARLGGRALEGDVHATP